MKSNIISSLKETLFDNTSTITESILDLAEIALDSKIAEGVLRDIPILNTIANLCKTGFIIRNKILLVQLAKFIEAYNSKTIDPVMLEKHRRKLEDNPKKFERELQRIIILLDRAIEEKQSKNLGAFYRNYINCKINYAQFVELSEANDRLFLIDVDFLKEIYYSPIKENAELTPQQEYQIERLKSLGLIVEDYSIIDSGTFENWNEPRDFISASTLGNLFVTMME